MAAYLSFQAYVYRGKGNPLGGTIEDLSVPMTSLSGLFFEWDGSLTWTNQSEGWQINGTVYDNAVEIQYVDLHARVDKREQADRLCERMRELLSIWGVPDELMLLRLPDRRWQNLQDFENEVLQRGPVKSSDT